MQTYTAGLAETRNLLAAAAFFLFLFSLAVVVKARTHTTRAKLVALAVLALGIAPVCFALLLFPAVFSTCNLLTQDLLQTDFWKGELATGVFALRVTSYVLTVRFFIAFRRLVTSHKALVTPRLDRGLGIDDATNHTVDAKEDERLLRVASDVNFQSAFQFTFYLCCVTALWASAILGAHSVLTSLASWCLFFIIDDWAVIADYTNQFSVPVITGHLYKILGFDAALFFLVGAVAVIHLEMAAWLTVLFVQAICLLGVTMYSWRSQKFAVGNKADA